MQIVVGVTRARRARAAASGVCAAVAVIAVSALVLAGCGGGGSTPSAAAPAGASVAPGARLIPVTARSFSFTPDHLVVRAGENLALQLHAVDAQHSFAIEGYGHVVTANAGTTRTGGFRLDRAGTYTFYCELPGHRAAGMHGTITVTP